MAKTKTKKRRSNKFTVPISIAVGFLPAISKVVYHTQAGGWSSGSREAGRILIGYDWWENRFNPAWLTFGLAPIVLGGVAHRFIGGRLGINRMLAAAKVPILRL